MESGARRNGSGGERAYWVLLSMVAGIGPVRFRRLVELQGGAQAAWQASDTALTEAGLDRRAVQALKSLRSSVLPDAALARLERLGVRALTLEDADYPEPLRQITDPPPVLYVRGTLQPEDARALAFVGTRRATAYGRAVAERFARETALSGFTIVSGLARGVDAIAHRAALDAGGRTLAVLGNGLDQVYPPEHAGLAQRIVESGQGALISEFALGVPPDAVNFPRRNRLISGLSQGTVVVEAGARSGALITADFALEQGREVFAVPGSVLSPMCVGPNSLIRQGATPLLEIRDVVEALGGIESAAAPSAATAPAGLSPTEERAFGALADEPRHVDEIARDVGLPVYEVSAALALLEVRGLASQAGAMAYIRAQQRYGR